MNGSVPFWAMEGVSKRYGGVVALDAVDFTCERGRIHAILGENGAGKSTLIKVIAGIVPPDQGTMALAGRPVAFTSPTEARHAGIVCVFQELSLLPDLTVADNICITDPPRRFGLIDRAAQRRRAEALLARVGCEDLHPASVVRDLPLSRRQMVEIAKALGRDPQLLILDEATSALTAADVAKVNAVIRKLRDDGLAVLYISHRMHEIAELADDCSVFRNGRRIDTFAKGTHGDDEIIEMMIGRSYRQVFPPKPVRDATPAPLLAVRKLGWGERIRDIDLTVGAGEIVGLGGLDGQGQRELLLALFGVLRGVSGSVSVADEPALFRSPAQAKRAKAAVALIPEDRKTEGLMLPMSLRDNISIAALDSCSVAGFVVRSRENAAIADEMRRLAIKAATSDVAVSTLSGGNQQKVVIGKWLMTAPKVILLNDPTRGIDVGTKQELYALLRQLADGGAAILFYSTDYEELIGCCDRVAVMYDGRIVRTLAGAEITERNIVGSALNLAPAGPGRNGGASAGTTQGTDGSAP
jgi:ribose transport system ATP-binding protein